MKMCSLSLAIISSVQFNHHIHCILKSGLILDEDMDSILMHYSTEDESPELKLSFNHKLLSGLSITGAFLSIRQKYNFFIVPIALIPLFYVGIQHIRERIYRKNQKRNIEKLIQSLCSISKLNRMICEYFKLKNVSSSSENLSNPFKKTMQQLMETIFKEEVNLLDKFREYVKELGSYVEFLRVDYAHLNYIELEEFDMNNVSCINDCVIYLQKLSDIYILIVSNCLTCLAITLSPNIWAKNDFNVDKILDLVVPAMKKQSEFCYNTINRKFDDVKYYYLNRKQIKMPSKPATNNPSSKLYIATCNVMMQTSEILEKSQIIFKKLKTHHLQTLEEKIEFSAFIENLRGQVFDYYESIDVLLKLYEVHINRSKPPFQFKVENSIDTMTDSVALENNVPDASLNSSEPSGDEEYELYIGASETSEGTNLSFYEEEESRRYLSLLNQELKQKIKNHSQFIAARKKRGIIDEDSDVLDEKEKSVDQDKAKIPNFEIPSLPLPIGVPDPLPNCDSFDKILSGTNPPPLPPPLPPIDLGPYGDTAQTPQTVTDDFLESIKAISKMRKKEEDIFETGDIEEQ